VAWYRDNPGWWGPIRSGQYREYYERQYGQRITTGTAKAEGR
jgi:dTDP-glucose 4,6-dehydratase